MYDIETNYFVFANAGSGKTTALVNRFLKLCLTGSDPEKIYCITYTNAATNEMILRINKKIDFFLKLSENEFLQELKQIDLFPNNNEICIFKKTLEDIKSKNLKISTIDSICYEILQQQLTYNINIITEDIKNNIIEKVLNVILNYHKNQEDFNKSLDYILNIFSRNFLKKIVTYGINNFNNINTILLKYNIKKYDYFKYRYLLNPEILEYEKINLEKETNKIRSEIISSELIFKKIKVSKSLKALNAILDNWELQVKKKSFVENFLLAIIDKNGHIYKNIKKIEELSSLIKNIEKFLNLENNFQYFQNLKHISSILIQSVNFYEKIKIQDNYYSFQDVRSESLKVLECKNNLMIEVDLKIEHLLIDESQDLSESGWAIINKITEEFFYGIGSSDRIKTFFAVGDFKQSIFSFQGSDVNLLFKNYEKIKKKSEFANIKFQKVDLNISYRSSNKILNIINELYDKEYFKINMIEYSKHICHNKQSGNAKYYELINISNNNTFEDEKSDDNSIQWEINSKINKLKKNQNSNNSAFKIDYLNNFMILYRNENEKIAEIVSKNNLSNILTINFYTLDILSLLIFILNNSDLNNKFYLIHSKFNQDLKNFEKMELLTFIKSSEKVNEFRSLNLHLLIKKIYLFISSNAKLNQKEKNNYYINLDIILKILSKNYNIMTIEDLVNLIITSPKIINSNFYKEKIEATTIHSSKGLEADEIYILDYEINTKLEKNNLLIYKDSIWIKDRNNKYSSDIIEEYENKMMSEEMRVLYVALTRAKNKITILSNKKGDGLWLSDFINSNHLI